MLMNNFFEIEGTTLVKYIGDEKNVKIPNGIKEIGCDAFRDNEDIVSVEFSQEVEMVGSYAFDGCDNLKCLTFGSSLKHIQFGAFDYYSESISIIIYQGSIEDWPRPRRQSAHKAKWQRPSCPRR